jgi:hypothetical protein
VNDTTKQGQPQWLDGAPLAIPSEAVLTDLLAYRRMTCPGCGRRGMKATPQQSDGGAYRVLASCRTCRYFEVC